MDARTFSLAAAFLGFGLCLFLIVVLFPQRNASRAGWPSVVLAAAFGVWHAVSFFDPLHAAWRIAGFAALGVGFAMALWLLWMGRRDGSRLFLWGYAAAVIAGAGLLPRPWLTAAPPFFLGWFLYWENTFGLVVSQQSVFALGMGIAAAFYLTAVRWIAYFVETHFDTERWFVEAAMLLFAGILWIPFYAGLSRFLTRRERLQSEFHNAIFAGAEFVLPVARRADYFAHRLQALLRLRKARIVLETGGTLYKMAASGGDSVFWRARLNDAAARAELESYDANAMIPLRHDNRVAGMLFLGTRRWARIDVLEAALAGMAPQVAHSLESCRLLEEKIALEHLASVGRMAAGIAHEIKNPLSAIQTIAAVMREDPAVAAAHGEDLSFIVSETARLDASVRSLLGYSRAAPAVEETVDLSALAASTLHALQRQANAEGKRLGCILAPGVVLQESSNLLWKQILLNLVLNALDAAPVDSQVEVELLPGPRLSVRDYGAGVPEALREKIFEPFFTTREVGTGLGLAIVRKNARQLGCKANLDCPEGGGTRVVIEVA